MVDPDNACGAPLMFAKFKVVQNHPRVPGPLNIGKEPYDRSKCCDINCKKLRRESKTFRILCLSSVSISVDRDGTSGMKEHLVVEVGALSSSLSYSAGISVTQLSVFPEKLSHQASIASNYFLLSRAGR